MKQAANSLPSPGFLSMYWRDGSASSLRLLDPSLSQTSVGLDALDSTIRRDRNTVPDDTGSVLLWYGRVALQFYKQVGLRQILDKESLPPGQ